MNIVSRLSFAASMLAVGASALSAQDQSAEAKLNALIAEERQFYYQENPGAGPKSEPRQIAKKMALASAADQARRLAFAQDFIEKLEIIDPASLDEEGRLNLAMLRFKVESDRLFLQHRTWRQPLFSDSGFHTSPTRMWRGDNYRSVEDYRAYIERLKTLPQYLAEHTANLQTGMQEGFTMPRVVLEGLLPTFGAIVVDRAPESSFYTPFNELPETISQADAEALRAEATDVIENLVLPAYAKLAAFMEEEYYPAARSSIAISDVPGGPEYYQAMVRYYTTLDITPDEVHQTGLREVARIRAEMQDIIKQVGFEGDFASFIDFLRTDPQFYAKSERELIMLATYIAKQIDGRLPKLFGTLPRQPYGVEPVPAALAPNYTTGRYLPAPLEAPRGGYYWVNTYGLDKRPMYAIPALTLHEAMPGHHLQIALSSELEGVPEFRQDIYPHAFGEGWGLYAEKLGLELDVYETPYDHFGRLSYEMWRACRLVVDTGIHAKGWTREQAIQLLEDNSALSKHNIRVEIDRYIAWPGQALAYKMGELKILELRERAEAALGANFDVRAFHDVVLGAGGIPLYLLEQRVDAWIASLEAKGE